MIVATGRVYWDMEAGAFTGSSVLARKTDEEGCRFSGVLRPRSVEGPDVVRRRDGEEAGTAEADGDDLVYRARAATAGCWVTGLFCLEVAAVDCVGCWLVGASCRLA